jgi:hypothetical protein
MLLSRVLVTLDGVWVGEQISSRLIQSTRTYKQYNVIADLHNLQLTVTHAIGFSVFTSRILITEIKKSHCD